MAIFQSIRGILPLVILAIFLGKTNLKADPSLPLPGHRINLSTATIHCYGALVATLMKVEFFDAGSSGKTIYRTSWKVQKVLRGEYPSEAKLLIELQTFPKSYAESMPTENETYILISGSPEFDHQQIPIVLKDTPENLEKVEKLLQQ